MPAWSDLEEQCDLSAQEPVSAKVLWLGPTLASEVLGCRAAAIRQLLSVSPPTRHRVDTSACRNMREGWPRSGRCRPSRRRSLLLPGADCRRSAVRSRIRRLVPRRFLTCAQPSRRGLPGYHISQSEPISHEVDVSTLAKCSSPIAIPWYSSHRMAGSVSFSASANASSGSLATT